MDKDEAIDWETRDPGGVERRLLVVQHLNHEVRKKLAELGLPSHQAMVVLMLAYHAQHQFQPDISYGIGQHLHGYR